MTTELTSTEYRRLMELPPAGSLPSEMDLSGERKIAEAATLLIPGMPAYAMSPNSRKHWAVKGRESADLQTRVIVATGRKHRILGPVVITWSIFAAKGRKAMDRDNAIATLKPAMDGLVLAGLIEGDSPDIVTAIEVRQFKWADHKTDSGCIAVTIQQAGARIEGNDA